MNFNPLQHLSQQDPTMEICKNMFLKVLMLVKLKCLVFHVLSSHFTQIQGHHLCINIAKLCNIMFHFSPLAFEVPGKAISSPTRPIVIVMARNPLLKCRILSIIQTILGPSDTVLKIIGSMSSHRAHSSFPSQTCHKNILSLQQNLWCPNIHHIIANLTTPT